MPNDDSGQKQTQVKCSNGCQCELDINEAIKIQSNYFCYIPLKNWLEYLLPKIKNQLRLRSSLGNENISIGRVYRDIVNGREYDRVTEGQDMLTLIIGFDGVRYTKTQSKSFWPLVAYIAELPYRIRIRNALVLGIHAGQTKAPESMFKPLIDELLEFEANPLQVSIGDKELSLKVRILTVVADAPARATILNCKDFSGKHGCNICQVTTFWDSNASRYPMTTDVDLRTNSQWREAAMRATPSNEILGVKGTCELLRLPYIDIVWIAPPEYMHSQLIGTVKAIIECWIDKNQIIHKKRMAKATHDQYKKYFYLQNKIELLQSRINSIKLPTKMCRQMPDFARFGSSKAYDIENFLLYGWPCLNGLLPTGVYNHFLRLVFVISSLSARRITDTTLRMCRTEIAHFIDGMEEFYPVELFLSNVHALIHLPDCVEKYGPLLSWSAFQTENTMGILARRVMSETNVATQVLKKIAGTASIMLICSLEINQFGQDFREFALRRFPSLIGVSTEFTKCTMVESHSLTNTEWQRVSHFVQNSQCNLRHYNGAKVHRVYYHKMVITTSDYRANAKHNSSIVLAKLTVFIKYVIIDS